MTDLSNLGIRTLLGDNSLIECLRKALAVVSQHFLRDPEGIRLFRDRIGSQITAMRCRTVVFWPEERSQWKLPHWMIRPRGGEVVLS